MKRTKLLLFAVGFLLEVTAFVVSQADSLPWVVALLSPTSAEASAAMDQLSQKLSMSRSDKGFAALERVIKTMLLDDKRNTPEVIAGVTVDSVKYGSFSMDAGRLNNYLTITFSDGHSTQWNSRFVFSRLADMSRSHLFLVAVVLFALGLTLSTIAFVIDLNNERGNVPNQASEATSEPAPDAASSSPQG